MSNSNPTTLYTIGHSTRDINTFIDLLLQHDITVLVDVRSLPGSNKFPHFNQDALAKSLKENGIEYHHLIGLGGRRKPIKDSKNTVWRNKSFQAYADYMETEEFKIAVAELKDIAHKNTTAIICSEAVWWRCHRALISDFLKIEGWDIEHIISKTNVQEHPYTSAAKIVDNKLSYKE